MKSERRIHMNLTLVKFTLEYRRVFCMSDLPYREVFQYIQTIIRGNADAAMEVYL